VATFVFVVAVFNAGLGFAIAVYLGRRNGEPLAAGPAGLRPAGKEADPPPTTRAAPTAPTPAIEPAGTPRHNLGSDGDLPDKERRIFPESEDITAPDEALRNAVAEAAQGAGLTRGVPDGKMPPNILTRVANPAALGVQPVGG
jgi:hypothetical protein